MSKLFTVLFGRAPLDPGAIKRDNCVFYTDAPTLGDAAREIGASLRDLAGAAAYIVGLTLGVMALTDTRANAAPSFQVRANAFYSAIREKPTEYNCAPRVCHRLAQAHGLTFNESSFGVCDAANPRRCALPTF